MRSERSRRTSPRPQPVDQLISALVNHDRLFHLVEEIAVLITTGQTVGLRARCVIALALWTAHERVIDRAATKRERDARARSSAAVKAMLSAGAEGRSIRTLRKLLSTMLDVIESEQC